MTYQAYQPNDLTLVLVLEGRFDAEMAAQVSASWEENRQVRNIVVDLSRVTVMDSPGLAALVNGQSRVRDREGDLILANPSEAATTILALTGLNRTFEIAPTVENALARFGAA